MLSSKVVSKYAEARFNFRYHEISVKQQRYLVFWTLVLVVLALWHFNVVFEYFGMCRENELNSETEHTLKLPIERPPHCTDTYICVTLRTFGKT